MTVAYPSVFPLPAVDGYSINARSGLIQGGNDLNLVQRQVFNTMPQTLNLVFNISAVNRISWNGRPTKLISAWNSWVLQYGPTWFSMPLPTMYAGLLKTTRSTVLLRFTSDINFQAVTIVLGRANVTAELAPSMIDDAMGA